MYETIVAVSKENTDFDLGFDHLFRFMAEWPESHTTKGFINYHVDEMNSPTTNDGEPEFTYLVGREFVLEQWVSEEDIEAFQEWMDL